MVDFQESLRKFAAGSLRFHLLISLKEKIFSFLFILFINKFDFYFHWLFITINNINVNLKIMKKNEKKNEKKTEYEVI